MIEPMETIHIYFERGEPPKASLIPLILSCLVLLAMIAVGILPPNTLVYTYETIRVPAVVLPIQQFSVDEMVSPTGIKVSPAPQAHGSVTLYNGSVINQELPAGVILSAKDDIEIVTDQAVFVAPGNPPYYGIASVPAHAVIAGTQGNIPAFAIDEIYGTSLYIRNTQAFTGGKESYTKRFITPQDRANALLQARSLLTQKITGLLFAPCREDIQGVTTLQLTWTCQFVTYETLQLPHLRVLDARLKGRTVFLNVVFVAHPRIIQFK